MVKKPIRIGDYDFPMMQDIIPEGQSGDYRIEHFSVNEAEADLYMVRAIYNRDYLGRQFRDGDFCRLMNKGLITSDGGGERWSNHEVCYQAHGNVLIAGLGIGMILTKIVPKPEVKKVTVVETSQDVVSLVEKPLRKYLNVNSPKLEIVVGDIWQFAPQHKYNVIWFDIWGDYSGDTYEETKKLHHKFQKYLDRLDSPYMDSWMRWHMKDLYFEGKKDDIWGGKW